jgi:2-polyprenyl-3-methyl-5-hydroxy-6-metoxy-1,4-benzoquinol methylase
MFNNSYIGLRPDLLQHIKGEHLRVLDVGCAAGANGKWLMEHDVADHIEGIEISSEMAIEAAKHYHRVHIGNLDGEGVLSDISDQSFDWILLGDVLEHLIDPGLVLERLVKKLKVGGRTVISVPNMRHIDVFIHLFVKGIWPKNERGIFDKTHLQVFTEKKLRSFIGETGLFHVDTAYNYRVRDKVGSQFTSYPLDRVLRKIFPKLYVFQIIVVARRDS